MHSGFDRVAWMAARRAGVFCFSSFLFLGALHGPAQAGPLDDARIDYRLGRYEAVVQALEPEAEPEADLLAGLALARLDRPDEAVTRWTRFLETSDDPTAMAKVRRHRSFLLREAARRQARAALAREASVGQVPDADTVAVLPFTNLAGEELAPLSKAFAAILIDDLSRIPDTKVLERARVQALVNEGSLGATIGDAATSVRVGRLLRAARVVAGSYVDEPGTPRELRIDAQIVSAAGGADAGADEQGPLEAVPRVVSWLSVKIGRVIEAALPVGNATCRYPVIERVPTTSTEALLDFGVGLDHEDRGDFAAAREAYESALVRDPDFLLAREALLSLPAAGVSLATVLASLEPHVIAQVTSALGAWGAVGAVAAAGAVGGGVALGAVTTRSSTSCGGLELGSSCANPEDCCSRSCAQVGVNLGGNLCCTTVGRRCEGSNASCCGVTSACERGRCCLQNGTPCSTSGDCCSATCVSGVCSSAPPGSEDPPACLGVGSTCTVSNECCTDACFSGACCIPGGSSLSCEGDDVCCGPSICSNGRCCRAEGQSCTSGSSCCSGLCSGAIGICLSAEIGGGTQ